jgi:hypothetical protein
MTSVPKRKCAEIQCKEVLLGPKLPESPMTDDEKAIATKSRTRESSRD